MVDLLIGMPKAAPTAPAIPLHYADIAVTATARDFAGFYRGKQYHEPDFDSVLERAAAAGVQKVLLTGMSASDIIFNEDITRRHPQQCSLTIGVHPYHAAEATTPQYLDTLFERVDALLQLDPCPLAAYGELGLDYDHLEWASKEVQIGVFKAQLDRFVAGRYDLPLFLHCRASFHDFTEVIRPYLASLPRKGIVHSFVGSASEMKQLVDMGFDISLNGFSFRDRESLEMVAAVPLSKLQIETDAPWGGITSTTDVAKRYLIHAPTLPASKKKDKFEKGLMVKDRNESCAISKIAFIVAGIRGVAVDEITNSAWQNSRRMFWPLEVQNRPTVQ